ncbi:MAG: T9SS type A sorting domain-containing protein [Flavobacteriales bacterium]|nr:T9SS type A sorting domain-containing protein [Flavobacteriales bacterium]
MKKNLLIALFSLAGYTAQSQLNNGLVANYPFDFGGGFNYQFAQHASIVGAVPASDRFGRTNMAFEFNGSSDYLIASDNSNINLDLMDGVSISAWINPSSNPAGLTSIVTKWCGSTSEQYGMWMDGNSITVGIRSISSVGITDNSNLQAGNWYHVVFTFDKNSGDHKVYVNNIVTLSQTMVGTVATTSDYTSLSMGAQANDVSGSSVSPNRFFPGKIDDVRIYNRALSAVEVDSLFNMPDPTCNGFDFASLTGTDASSTSSNDGAINFAITGGFGPYTYTVNGGSSNAIPSGSMCGYSFEGGSISLTAPGTAVFTNVNFSSYGTSNGSCGNFTYGPCHSMTSTSSINANVLGNDVINFGTDNGVFGDPCFGTGKYYNGQFSYAESVSLSNLATGTYTIEVTDSLGCSTSGTVTISAPSAITENTLNHLQVFPNPAQGMVTIKTENATGISISDISGKTIMTKTITGTQSIDLQGMEAGVYFIRDIRSNTVYKLIVQ